jgi:hypothetical protein
LAKQISWHCTTLAFSRACNLQPNFSQNNCNVKEEKN